MKKLFLLLTAILSLSLCASAQTRTVKGVVVSAEDDEPLIGATVLPVGGGQGTATDIDGKFSVTIPANVTQIKVSYVGMTTQTLPVSDNMTIKLAAGDNRLDEVVVTGYGSGKKLGSVVGAVSVVHSEAIEATPAATFVDALAGQVAGLSVLSSSGDPSSVANSIRIRGVNSIESGVTPLFILDGAPVSSAIFTTLNPGDIESITVLKDAASVAIYGSRAANGVIVITSKKGKYGEKARVTVRANVGWSQMTSDNIDMMNSKQYIQFRDLIGVPVDDEIRNIVDTYNISTDWRDEIFDNSALTYSLEAAIQGGSESVSYFLSLNHYDADGIIDQSGMRREALRASINAKVNDWFRVGFQGNLGYTKYETNGFNDSSRNNINNPVFLARYMLPYDSPRYYTIDEETGKLIYGDKAKYYHYSGTFAPEALNEGRSRWKDKVTANIVLYEQINPIKGLTIKAQQAVDAFDYTYKNLQYPVEPFVTPMGDECFFPAPGQPFYFSTFNSQGFERYYSFTYTNTAEYRFDLNSIHNFSFLLGQEAIITKDRNFYVASEGQSDARQMLLTQGTEITMDNIGEGVAEEVFNSYFLTGSYDYDGKYFIDATFRRDGSSKFAPGHRWANFFSVGAMWNAKAEAFLAPYTWLSDLKLSLSYGTTGNSSIGNYAYFGLIGSGGTSYGPDNAGTLFLAQAPNENLTWETVRSFDFGLSFGLFDRVNFDVDVYRKETKDMILSVPWSYTTGYGGNSSNVGSMKNVGVDVDVKADIYKSKDWYVGARVNFNYNKNTITELFNGQDEFSLPDYGMQLKVGHSYGELYAVPYLGVDPRDGKQMWLDINGNVTKAYNEERDARLTGKSFYAPWNGGFGFDVRWRDISLHTDFAWQAQKYMTNNDLYFVNNANMGTQMNQSTAMLDVWTHEGQVTDIPAYGEEVQFDTRLIEDASFLRMKNLTVNYSLPKSILKKIYLENVTFHFTGRNLWTITDFTGYDPEPEGNLTIFAYPNTRQYEFGVEVTF